MLKLRPSSIVALDIGERAVSWIELSRRRSRINVESVGRRRFSKALDLAFDTTTDDEIGEAIGDVTAEFAGKRVFVTVGLAAVWMDCRLIHLGSGLSDEEIAFHVSQYLADVPAGDSRAEPALFDYRVIGCCRFDPSQIDVLLTYPTAWPPRRIVDALIRSGLRPRCVDVDAWVVARALSRAGFSFPTVARRASAGTAGTVDEVFIDPARHGRPVVPCRVLTAGTAMSASARAGAPTTAARGVLELSRAYLRRVSCTVTNLDVRLLCALAPELSLDPATVPDDAVVATLHALETMRRTSFSVPIQWHDSHS